ncbi:hypothetical protein [Mesorhizobium sp. LCM 4577]|uniref:hypothetical protein n=1 Tax=Mesorhizobium sp. LCM 4577 TaxID=1848288 RepID=UPI0010427B1A
MSLTAIAGQSALAADCPASVTSLELAKKHYKLHYVTLNMRDSATSDQAVVDAFYFGDASCEYRFMAPQDVTFTKAEISEAALNRQGFKKLAKKLGHQAGVSPAVMTNSPTFQCFDNQSKVCKEAAARQ